ncbi:MAG: hypothetical protein V4795_13195 [Pseudomonadota bacterium]
MRLDLVDARDRLKPRREPYWQRVEAGQFLGYRHMTRESAGSWLARSRDEETGKQRHLALGEFVELPPSRRFDAAAKAAREWFAHLGKGGTARAVTVKQACEDYVKHVRDGRGDGPADDMEGRFERWVYSSPLAKIELAKLTRAKVEAWRKGLAATPAKINRDDRDVPLTRPRAPSSVNRDMATLKAALNYAHDLGHATTDEPWRVALRPIKNADGRRDVYLDAAQRRTLIEHARADVAVLLRGLHPPRARTSSFCARSPPHRSAAPTALSGGGPHRPDP